MKIKHLLLILTISIIGMTSLTSNYSNVYANSYRIAIAKQKDVQLLEDSSSQSNFTKVDVKKEEDITKEFEIGMKHADTTLNYIADNNYSQVIVYSELAIKHLDNSISMLTSENVKEFGVTEDVFIKEVNSVKATLYYEKAKGEIEYKNDIPSGREDLRNALKMDVNDASNRILSFARSAIRKNEKRIARIYLNEIINCVQVPENYKITAKQLRSTL